MARAPWARAQRPALVTAAAVVIGGLFATWEPAILSGYGYSFANHLVHGE